MRLTSWLSEFVTRRVRNNSVTRFKKRTRKQISQKLEWLEDRCLLATFAGPAGNPLTIGLNAANSSLAIQATATGYVLTLTGDTWTSGNIGGATGSGTAVLTVTPDTFSALDINDTPTGISVAFSDSGSEVYTDDISVVLNNAGAGAITFSGSTTVIGTLNVSTVAGVTVGGNLTSGGLTVNADSNNDGTGNFTVSSGTTQTTGASNIAITAANVDLTGATALGSGTTGGVAITASNNRTIGLGATGGNLTLDGAEIQKITATSTTLNSSNATAAAIVVNGITAANTANAGSINLNTTNNLGGIAFSTGDSVFTETLTVAANNGIAVNINLSTTSGSISLNGDANAANNGTDRISIASGKTLQAAGSGSTLSLSAATGGISGSGALTLSGQDGVTINNNLSSAGLLTINADNDANGTGTLTISAGTTQTTGANNIAITAADVGLTGSLTSGQAASITASNNRTIGLGATSQDLTLSDTEFDKITTSTGVSIIGTTATGTIVVNGLTVPAAAGAVTLTSGGTIQFNTGASTFAGALTVSAGAAITQSATIGVTGASSFSAGANVITLTQNNNFQAAVSLTNSGSNAVAVKDTGAIILGASSVGSTLDVTAGGAISQTGSISATTLTTSSAGGTNLGTSTNTVTGFNAVNTASGNVALTNSATTLTVTGISQAGGGDVSVNNTGALTTSTSAISTSANGAISLQASNGILTVGAAITAGGSGTVGLTSTVGTNAILVQQAVTSTSGQITVHAAGAITESGSGKFGTSGVLSTQSSGGQTLNLLNTVGNFSASNSSGGMINLTNTATTLTVSGISQPGGGDVSVINAGALTNSGTVTTTISGNIALQASGLLTIADLVTVPGASTVGLTSTGGNINPQAVVTSGSGQITVNAAGTITETVNGKFVTTGVLSTTSTGGQDLTNSNAVGSFTASNSTSGGVSLKNTAATLTITGITQTGGGTLTLDVVANNMTQTGDIEVGSGALSLTGSTITLSRLNNTFGAVTVATGAGDVSLQQDGAMSITGITRTSGNLTLDANAGASAISQAGAIAIAGGSLNLTGTTITLSNSGNAFGTVNTAAGSNVSLRDDGGFNVGTSSITGTLTLFSNGAITQSSALGGGASLVKQGTGTLTLSQSNTYTGSTTITTGTVLVNGSTSASSAVAVNGTLGGTGTVNGAVTVNAGGKITGADLATIGTLTVGSLAFNGGTYAADFNGNTSDTIVTSGTIDLQATAQGTFSVNSQTGTAANNNVFVLINNTHATNAIVDPPLLTAVQGTTTTVNTKVATYSYTGGAGANDFTLTTAGTFTYTGTSGNDAVTIKKVGTDIQIIDTGSNAVLQSLPATAVNDIVVNGADGNDTFTVDFTGGLNKNVTVNGDNPLVAPGDKLIILGGVFTSISNTLSTANSGSINLDGTVVVYTGLEPVLINVGSVTNMSFTLPDGGNTAFLEDDGTLSNGIIQLRSNPVTFEVTSFTVPSSSLTITGGSGNDTLTISAITDFHASLTVDGSTGAADVITLSNSLSLGSASANGNLSFTAETVNLGASINTDAGTTGVNGNVSLSATTVNLTTAVSIDTAGTGTNGSLTVVGAVAGAAQTLTLDVGSTNSISLVNAGNNFGTVAVTAANNVTLLDSNTIVLGASTISGTLSVTATAGSITDNGNVSVTSNASFNATTITLGDAVGETTNFGSLTFTSSGVVTITEDSQTDLTGTNTANSLNLTSSAAIVDATTTSLTVTNTATFSGTSVTLGDTVGDTTNFGSLTFGSAGAVNITEDSDTVLTGTSTANSLSLASAASITDAAGTSLTVTNGATFNATTSISLTDNADTLSIGANASFTGTSITVAATGTVNFGSLTTNTSGSGGSQNITEDSGLTAINLNAGAGNIVLTSAGTITDGDAGNDITATTATITVTSGNFGATGGGDNSIDTSVTNLNVSTSGANGSQWIDEATGLSTINLQAGTGDVTLLAGSTVVDGDAGNDITATTATITVTSGNFGATGGGDNSIDTSVTNLNVSTSGANGSQWIDEATGLSTINLQAGTGTVILAAGGAIADGDGSNDITATSAAVTAVGGIGSTTAIQTAVTNLAFANTTSGNVQFVNTGALTIANFGGVTTSTNTGSGNISVQANSPLTINVLVSGPGDILLQAGNSAADNDDLTINANITSTGGGTIDLIAGDDISQTAGTITSTAGVGARLVRIKADNEGAGGDTDRGDVTQSAGNILATNLVVRSYDSVALGTVATNNVTNLAANVTNSAASFNYQDADSVTITTVDGVSGLTTNAGAITVNATSGTITVSQPITSTTGTGGGISISGSVTINASITAAGGSITLNGNTSDTSDLTINSPLVSSATLSLSAPRDVIVAATVQTTGVGADISLNADSNTNGTGGVWIKDTGLVTSNQDVLLQGSDLFATGSGAAPLDSILIDADTTPANDQVLAARSVTIQNRAAAPAGSDTILKGVVHAQGTGTVTVSAKTAIETSSTVTSSNGTITFNQPVILIGNSVVTSTAGNVQYVSTINGAFNLTITSGTGNTIFDGNVGSTTPLSNLTVNTSSVTPLALDVNFTVTTRTTLNATVAGVNQTAGFVHSADLLLLGTGSFTLNQVTNDIDQLAGSTASGNVSVTESDGFTVGTVGATVGFTIATSGTLTLISHSPITFAANTTAPGTITANAVESVATDFDNVTVNTGVTVESTGGDVLFNAGDRIIVTSGATVRSDVGNIVLTSGVADTDNDGSQTLDGTIRANNSATTRVTIDLQAEVGTAAQSSAGKILAGQLRLLSTAGGAGGSFALAASATNDVVTMAANTTGSIAYADANALVVGTAGTVGITTTNDDVQLFTGGTLLIDDDINVGNGNLGLDAGAAVTQNAGDDIAAAGLALTNVGPFTLTNVGNAVTTLAAASANTISYVDSNSLIVGAVTVTTVSTNVPTTGISTSDDDVRLTATVGSLTINNTINLSNGGGGGSGGSLDLVATTGATQAGGANILANTLLLRGTGAAINTNVFNLPNATNNVAIITANLTNGAVTYYDADALTVGISSVNAGGSTTAATGITVGNPASVAPDGGDVFLRAGQVTPFTGLLTVTQIIDTNAGTFGNLTIGGGVVFSGSGNTNVGSGDIDLEGGAAVPDIVIDNPTTHNMTGGTVTYRPDRDIFINQPVIVNNGNFVLDADGEDPVVATTIAQMTANIGAGNGLGTGNGVGGLWIRNVGSVDVNTGAQGGGVLIMAGSQINNTPNGAAGYGGLVAGAGVQIDNTIAGNEVTAAATISALVKTITGAGSAVNDMQINGSIVGDAGGAINIQVEDTLTLNGTISLTTEGNITIDAEDMVINTGTAVIDPKESVAGNATGIVWLRNRTAGRQIDVGGGLGGARLTLTNAELNRINHAQVVRIGRNGSSGLNTGAGAGRITVTAMNINLTPDLVGPQTDLHLITSADIVDGGANGAGGLGTITETNVALEAGTGIDLHNVNAVAGVSGNDVDNLAILLTGGDGVFKDRDDVNFQIVDFTADAAVNAVNVTNNLTMIMGGNLTQTNAVHAGGLELIDLFNGAPPPTFTAFPTYYLPHSSNTIGNLEAYAQRSVNITNSTTLTVGTVANSYLTFPATGSSGVWVQSLQLTAPTVVVNLPIETNDELGFVTFDVTTLLDINANIFSRGKIEQIGTATSGVTVADVELRTTDDNITFLGGVTLDGASLVTPTTMSTDGNWTTPFTGIPLAANAATTTGGGNVVFNSTLRSNPSGDTAAAYRGNDLTLETGTGNIQFIGQVGGASGAAGRLGVVNIVDAHDVTASTGFSANAIYQQAGDGETAFNGFVQTNGRRDVLTPTAATNFGVDITTKMITLNAAMQTTSAPGSGAAAAIRFNNSGTLSIVAGAGSINSDGAVSQVGTGNNLVGGDIVTTNDNISFASDTYLSGSPIQINSQNADVSFAARFQINNKTVTIRDKDFVDLGTVTAIAGGVLNVFVANTATRGSIQAGSGETITGAGTMNTDVNVLTGGTLAPAMDASGLGTGILTINGNVVLAANAVYAVDLNGTVAGSSYDQVVTGATFTFTSTGAILSATRPVSFNPTTGSVLKIIDGSVDVVGNFSNAANGTYVYINGLYFRVDYDVTAGDLTLTRLDPPGSAVTIIDDNGSSPNTPVTGFTLSPNNTTAWSPNSVAGRGYANDLRFASPGTGSSTALYTFTGLIAGHTYRVSTTWFPHINRATDSPFTVDDGAGGSAAVTTTINQRNSPDDFTSGGSAWEDLVVGGYTISSTTLTVLLTNNTSTGYVIADAVRIEDVTGAAPEIVVTESGNDIADGTGVVDFGTTSTVGADVTKTISIKNTGLSPLVLSSATITPPAGFSISGYTPQTIAPGATGTPFTITLSHLVAGNYSGQILFNTNDFDENPFNFTIKGGVTSGATLIADNLTSGSGYNTITGAANNAGTNLMYGEVGLWHNNDDSKVGYLQDLRYAAANSNSQATWTFSGLATGTYRVSVTFRAESNRASNASFTVTGTGVVNPTTIQINQRVAPNQFQDANVYWIDLAPTFGTISAGGTITVTLDALGSNGFVIADAVRVEFLHPLQAAEGPAAEPTVAVLTAADLDATAAAAVARWQQATLSAAQQSVLNGISFAIADLPDAYLGSESDETIFIDSNAAGYGWYVDSTPYDDAEFGLTIASTELGATDPVAANEMDLLTVLLHEIGHRLGLDDVALTDDAHGLMAESLDVGTRRLPVAAAVSEGDVDDDCDDASDAVDSVVSDEVFYTLGAANNPVPTTTVPTIMLGETSGAAHEHHRGAGHAAAGENGGHRHHHRTGGKTHDDGVTGSRSLLSALFNFVRNRK